MIWPLRQLLHLACASTSRTLKDRIMGIYDENMIKTIYCDQRRYDLFDPSDNEDEDVRSLVETLDDDNDDDDGDDDVMRPPVLEFGHDTGVDDMVCNDWSVYQKTKISWKW